MLSKYWTWIGLEDVITFETHSLNVDLLKGPILIVSQNFRNEWVALKKLFSSRISQNSFNFSHRVVSSQWQYLGRTFSVDNYFYIGSSSQLQFRYKKLASLFSIHKILFDWILQQIWTVSLLTGWKATAPMWTDLIIWPLLFHGT